MNTAQVSPWFTGPAVDDERLDRLLLYLRRIGVKAQTIPYERDETGECRSHTGKPELLVYVDRSDGWWPKALSRLPLRWLLERVETPLLLARDVRLPIRHILLVVRAEASDSAAVEWIVRLAHTRNCEVSILPIVPAWPGLYDMSRYMQPAPNVLLDPATCTGSSLGCIMRELQESQIPTHLLLCAGEPNCRIQETVSSCNPDLVVIAAETHNIVLRWLYGELVAPMLCWIDRPLLVAR